MHYRNQEMLVVCWWRTSAVSDFPMVKQHGFLLYEAAADHFVLPKAHPKAGYRASTVQRPDESLQRPTRFDYTSIHSVVFLVLQRLDCL